MKTKKKDKVKSKAFFKLIRPSFKSDKATQQYVDYLAVPSLHKAYLFFVKAEKEYNPKFDEYFDISWDALAEVIEGIDKKKLPKALRRRFFWLKTSLSWREDNDLRELKNLLDEAKSFLEDCRVKGIKLK
ncbi:MAG: hypothetical protein NT129_06555 [Candidatus Aenigmarchaeota archaeon]|nr:hypothetical protein [Candidatus Aenigmarchaeota archaeon]